MTNQTELAQKYLHSCELAARRAKKCYDESGGKEKKRIYLANKKLKQKNQVEAAVAAPAPQTVIIKRRRRGMRLEIEEIPPEVEPPQQVIIRRRKNQRYANEIVPPPPPTEVVIKVPKSRITEHMVMEFLNRPFAEIGFKSSGSQLKCIKDIATTFRLTGCSYFEQCVRDFDNIKSKIENAKMPNGQLYSVNSRAGYFYSIRWVYTHMDLKISDSIKKKYNDLLTIYHERSLVQTKQNKIAADKAVLPESDYSGKIVQEFGRESKEYLVTQLYLQIPCRDDLYLTVVPTLAASKKDTKKNYCIVPRGNGACKVILNVYKTSAKYGDLTYDLDMKLSELIREWIAKHEIATGAPLWKDISLSSFVSKMNKKIGIQGSINYLRHLAISGQNIDSMSIEELHQRATQAGHSITMHRDYCRAILAK